MKRGCFAALLAHYRGKRQRPQIDWEKEQHTSQLTTSAVLALGFISSAEICHMWRVGVNSGIDRQPGGCLK